MPHDYYRKKLAAENLRRVYETAPPRIRQYLDAEVDHVCSHIFRRDKVLELGCGYGRVLRTLADRAAFVLGIDTSMDSLRDAHVALQSRDNVALACMDAGNLAIANESFNVVLCIQNGISAFHVDRLLLMREALRVTVPDGRVLFSSYAGSFWDERLKWFELQSNLGLLGPIDYARTGAGEIYCTDGFHASTVGPAEFKSLMSRLDIIGSLVEVDRSSLFCEIIRR